MAKIVLKQEDKLSFKLNHLIPQGGYRRVDVYFLLPNEMGINPQTLTEEDYFYRGIQGKRAYYSEGLHLPLVQSRFASRMKRSPDEYRVNLNLFAYQFAKAFEKDISNIQQQIEPQLFYSALIELNDVAKSIIKKFRRNAPADEKLKAYFNNVDNYLSWFSEQCCYKALSKRKKSNEFLDERAEIIGFCRGEAKYRLENGYNSANTLLDPNRIANKMRLLRRLIEHGVIFKEATQQLGKHQQKIVKGTATSLVMVIVLSMIFFAQGELKGLTYALIAVLSVIYGFREIFKDEFNNTLWRWIRKGRPKWSRNLIDTSNKQIISKQRIWLDYIKQSKLPIVVRDVLYRRRPQNKQESILLHYRLDTRVSHKGFQAGYDRMQEQIYFSVRPLIRYLERGTGAVYTEHDSKISKEAIERRYQVNVVVGLKDDSAKVVYQRHKITVNRSGILDIEAADIFSEIL
ncbi:Putative uncharacterized protein [Moritella viscosa]|uniref:hypothetical protein n=1 Tax=Moritella viscosa TaxID=80854 RepID=UPI000915531F|nr:hypothetical protein [Moritella viscosa]SGY90515.1 Putative uncharacterized protein [Moritella viscosa]